MKDLISVIIPVYKVEAYLCRCLDSVINQTYCKLEIILVDDGSPDNCGKICDEYAKKDGRIKVIHKQNGGAPAARNDALKISTGDWIAYVDPDDWIEEDEFEQVMAVAQRDQPDIVIFNTYVNRENGEQEEKQAFPDDFVTDDKEKIYQLQLSSLNRRFNPGLHNWSQGFPWDKIYRTSRMLECSVLWPEHLKANDDVIYTIYAFQAARKVSYLNKTFYHYCYNPGSIGNKYTPDRIAIEKDIYAELLHIKEMYHLDGRFDQAMYARFVQNTWLNCRRCFFHPENKDSLKEKLKTVKEMLREEPFASSFVKLNRNQIDSKTIKLFTLFKNKSALWLYLIYKLDSLRKR